MLLDWDFETNKLLLTATDLLPLLFCFLGELFRPLGIFRLTLRTNPLKGLLQVVQQFDGERVRALCQ